MSEASGTGPRRLVEVVDTPRTRVRRPGDLVGIVVTILGIAVVLLLAVYAQATTEGVTEDVQSVLTRILRGVIGVPVSLLQALITLTLPWIVLVERLLARALRQVLEAIAAAVAGAAIAVAVVGLLNAFGPPTLIRGLSITIDGEAVIAMAPFVSAVAAFLTASGARDQRRSLTWSWNLFWLGLGLAVLTNDLTLPGAFLTVLLGRVAGFAVRYASGVYNERAYGAALVEGIRRAGLDPQRVVRVGGHPRHTFLTPSAAPIGYTERGLRPAADGGRAAEPPVPVGSGAGGIETAVEPAIAADPVALAHERPGQSRIYTVTDVHGVHYDLVALDGDRQVIGTLAAFWYSIRLRGIERRAATSLRQAAERASLMTYAAGAAGVRTPALVGVAEAGDTVLLAHEHVEGARRLADLAPEEISDAVLADVWAQLRRSHTAGLAHRDLTGDVVLVRGDETWIAGWANGEIASPELSRRLDLAQMLALLAVLVGVPRAVAGAAGVLEPSALGAVAPLLQPIALPAPTRALVRQSAGTLAELRSALLDVMPPAVEAEPVQLARFSARTVGTVTIAVVAVFLVLTTMNIAQITESVRTANVGWMAVAFGLGLATYVGAALTLVAFAPVRLGLWRTTVVQVAASVIALVTPAGVGPAALNARFLTRRRVEAPLALASVALVQVSQFVTTIALLLVIAAVTGTVGTLHVPDAATLAVLAAVVLALAGALLVPRLRAWVWARTAPTLRQVWPRVLWVVGQPRRLLLGLVGNVLMTGGFIAAFAASIAAFGEEVSATQLAIIFLGGTALGSAVPTPGGLGTVELAISGGLTAAGLPAAVAASIAVLFRVLTFWGRIPLGWLAMRYLQRKHDL